MPKSTKQLKQDVEDGWLFKNGLLPMVATKIFVTFSWDMGSHQKLLLVNTIMIITYVECWLVRVFALCTQSNKGHVFQCASHISSLYSQLPV